MSAMLLPADTFLALRYLRPKRTFISVISVLSVLGPILGVGLLVIVIAVMAGFDRDIRERILDLQAHLQVYPPIAAGDGTPVFTDTAPVLAALDAVGAHGSPLLEGPVLVQARGLVATKYLKGIVPATERAVTGIAKNVQGRYVIEDGEALIGDALALELGVGIGDRLLIHSPNQLTRHISWDEAGRIQATAIDEIYLPEEVVVAGIVSMGLYEYDSGLLFVHLDQAADLFGFEWGCATSVHASVPDPFVLGGLVAELRARLHGVRIVTWQEANRRLFGALRVEKNLMFFLLTFIVIVAAFGISGTLITVAVQKTREIGLLKAVGMTSGMVARIFMLQGAIIGLFGTGCGIALGLLVLHFRNQVAGGLAAIMGVEIFPKELYHLSQIPALVTPGDVLVIAGLALLICIAASLVPALYASALSPARALHEEN